MFIRLNLGDLLALVFGCYVVIFNRFSSDEAYEARKRMTGIYPSDPIKAKRFSGWLFVAFGLFLIVVTMIRAWVRDPVNVASDDISGPQRLLAGFGLLLGARFLVVRRNAAIDLTTEQARELFGATVPENGFKYLVVLFVGIFMLFGAIMITSGVRQL